MRSINLVKQAAASESCTQKKVQVAPRDREESHDGEQILFPKWHFSSQGKYDSTKQTKNPSPDQEPREKPRVSELTIT
jgi:hypothetical protein